MTSLDEIDPYELEDKVREIAAAHPDFIYRPQNGSNHSMCLYIHKDDKPGCLFGHALLALGVPVDELKLCNSESIPQLLQLNSVHYYWCEAVQKNQDLGKPWAKAVEIADEMSTGNNDYI